MEEEKL